MRMSCMNTIFSFHKQAQISPACALNQPKAVCNHPQAPQTSSFSSVLLVVQPQAIPAQD